MTQKRSPGKGAGGFGTASTFGSLDGWALAEADEYLSNHSGLQRRTVSAGDYRRYQFKDGSELIIRPDGQFIRLPSPMYAANGARIQGMRLSITGRVFRSAAWHNLPRNEQEWVVINDGTK